MWSPSPPPQFLIHWRRSVIKRNYQLGTSRVFGNLQLWLCHHRKSWNYSQSHAFESAKEYKVYQFRNCFQMVLVSFMYVNVKQRCVWFRILS